MSLKIIITALINIAGEISAAFYETLFDTVSSGLRCTANYLCPAEDFVMGEPFTNV